MSELCKGYKRTNAGILPEDWSSTILGEVATIKARIGWRGLKASEYTKSGPYLIAGKHIRGSKILWDKCDHLSMERYEESKEIQIREKDVVISKDGTIGRAAYIDKLPGLTTINGTMMLVRADDKNLIGQFIYYFFQGDKFQSLVKERISGSSIPHLFQKDMINFNIPLPSIEEQQKIAKILSTVDTQIEQTEQLIEKTKELKKGLMQQLLTKGIGHTEYKESELGHIPSSWEIKFLNDISNIKGGKRLPKGVDLVEENTGYPYLRIVDMGKGKILFDNIQYIPADIAPKLVNYRIYSGEIYITVAGALLGLVGMLPEKLDGINLTENADRICDITINNFYLEHYLKGGYIQNQISNVRTVNAQPKLSLEQIRNFKILIPPLDEQQKIADILSTVDSEIESYEQEKAKYEELKKGLMQQLLTGKIRVENRLISKKTL